jgi:hypothetical protein
MPRYYFDVIHGDYDRDDLGMELPHHLAAQSMAARFLGQLLMADGASVWEQPELRLEVRQDGIVIFSLCLYPTLSPAIHAEMRLAKLQ